MLFKLTQRWRLIIIVLDINLGAREGKIGKIASGLGSGRANKPRWASNQRARRDKTVCSTTDYQKGQAAVERIEPWRFGGWDPTRGS